MLVKNFRFSLLYTKRAKQYTYMNNNKMDTPLIQCFRNIDLLVEAGNIISKMNRMSVQLKIS